MATFGDVARVFGELGGSGGRGIGHLVSDVQAEVARFVERRGEQVVPVRTGRTRLSIAAGASRGRGDGVEPLSALRPGMLGVVGGSPILNILEGGRRASRTGRMIGSEQAPGGVFGPMLAASEGELEALAQRMVARAEAWIR